MTVTSRLISLLSPSPPSNIDVFSQALSALSAVVGSSSDAVLECNRTEHRLRSLFDQWMHADYEEVGTVWVGGTIWSQLDYA